MSPLLGTGPRRCTPAYVALADRTITIGPLNGCRGVFVSPDGQWLATGSHSVDHVRRWHLPEGAWATELPWASGAYFSPDGRWLIASETACRQWDVGSWREVRQIEARMLSHCRCTSMPHDRALVNDVGGLGSADSYIFLFLIPAKPRFKNEHDARSGRYGNFHEGKDSWGHEIDIHESDPDGFERVEGRYAERFLEGIPLVLRYVDVAYARRPPKAIHPSLGCLQAFRVSDRFRRGPRGALSNRGSPCLTTVTSM